MADSGVAGPVFISKENFSDIQLERLAFEPPRPSVFAAPQRVSIALGEAAAPRSADEEAALKSWFPATYGKQIVNIVADAGGDGAGSAKALAQKTARVGVVFCGRQCPGGHNVVAGLYDYVKAVNPANEVLGFAGGTKGLFDGKAVTLTAQLLETFRNQGGYHLLGRSVDKIRSAKEQAAVLATCKAMGLSGLVLVGGTYTNTDAAHLAEYLAANGCYTAVVGVPVTIDGDVHNQFVETTLGFDSATKVYAQLVGNLATDCNSAKKYTYFVRLMGRTPSHIALEVALQTHPNSVVLGEDIEARKLTLTDIVRELADACAARAAAGKNFGVVLVPEGAISFIPEMRTLIGEMNALFADGVAPAAVPAKLTPWSQAVLQYLPPVIRDQLFLERESSGAVQLSQISTERLLAELVGDELARRKAAGKFKGKFAALSFFFGYQARCTLPSNFDCAYGSALGNTAGVLALGGCGGYMATVRNLSGPVAAWEPTGVPLAAMLKPVAPASAMAAQAFSGVTPGATTTGLRPVLDSHHVDVHGGPFRAFMDAKAAWQRDERYSNPGPIQFHGETADDVTITLASERHDHMARIVALRSALDSIRDLCRPGVSDGMLDAALSSAAATLATLTTMKRLESRA